jgi:quercetin dioxygenase-like cupin family protein
MTVQYSFEKPSPQAGPPQVGDVFHVAGCLLTFRATGAETGGAYCLVDAIVAPGAGAPPNKHPGEEESFVVIDGAFEFAVDGERRRVGPGEAVTIPSGAVHAFTNVGQHAARLLILNRPGRMHEAFFSQAGEQMPAGTATLPDAGHPNVERLLAAGERNGMTFMV